MPGKYDIPDDPNRVASPGEAPSDNFYSPVEIDPDDADLMSSAMDAFDEFFIDDGK
jgi:hypothetical protein